MARLYDLRRKTWADYSEDMMAKSALDQMRTEATGNPSNGRQQKCGAAHMKGERS